LRGRYWPSPFARPTHQSYGSGEKRGAGEEPNKIVTEEEKRKKVIYKWIARLFAV